MFHVMYSSPLILLGCPGSSLRNAVSSTRTPVPEVPDMLKVRICMSSHAYEGCVTCTSQLMHNQAWLVRPPQRPPSRPSVSHGKAFEWTFHTERRHRSWEEARFALDKAMKNRTVSIHYPNGNAAWICKECENCGLLVKIVGNPSTGFIFATAGVMNVLLKYNTKVMQCHIAISSYFTAHTAHLHPRADTC